MAGGGEVRISVSDSRGSKKCYSSVYNIEGKTKTSVEKLNVDVGKQWKS